MPVQRGLPIIFDESGAFETTKRLIAQNISQADLSPDACVGYRYGNSRINCRVVQAHPLTCVKYDFTVSPYFFHGTWLGAQKPPPFDGFGSSSNGVLEISRGVLNAIERPLFAADNGLKISLSQIQQYPIIETRMRYTLRDPAENLQLNVTLGYVNNNDDDKVYSAMIANPSGYSRIATWILHPTKVVLKLMTPSSNVITLKSLEFCYDAGPPLQKPLLPPDAAQKCSELLADLRQRKQPFGQDELSGFPSDVTLEPYPEFSFTDMSDGTEPHHFRYDSRSGMSNVKLIPCIFKRNEQVFNPDARFSHKPIFRFTATGGTPQQREHLILLNYAAYFSLIHNNQPPYEELPMVRLSKRWCYYGDEAYKDGNGHNRADASAYRGLYNVPSLTYRCDTGKYIAEYAPCVTLVGSVYRAMGYFNVAAANVTSLAALYYEVAAWNEALARNRYGTSLPPFVRADVDVTRYTAVRAYSLRRSNDEKEKPACPANELYICVKDINPLTCPQNPNIPREDCQNAIKHANHNWERNFNIDISPLNKINLSNVSPQSIWQSIQPGAIAITVVEYVSGAGIYPHIEIIVGWGPKLGGYSRSDADLQNNLFPTWDSIPEELRAGYVPYILDRFSLDGTGNQRGPRPYNLHQYHTAVDFWVANVADSEGN
jgi:hypothetical protein